MNITVNKKKSFDDIRVVAKKAATDANVTSAQVVAVFDISGSMMRMYQDGTVEALATRVLAMAMQLDDNGIIPVYALNHDVQKLTDLTKDNLNDYVKKHLANIVDGSTNYAPTINEIVKDAQEGDPMLVLLFTDGDNYDEEEAEEALIRASNLPIFWQWYGIFEGRRQPAFGFLHKMDEMKGRVVDNAGFSPLGLNMVETGADDDQALFTDMLKEYKDYPAKAKAAGADWGHLQKVAKANPRHKLFGIF